ncbi:MAG: hypothetical protein LBS36_06975 [Oscillospiraceae bacterium]|jgi:hypothetical protein|nr:hypothetical protein [Oscillospiraceae bacterium]
MKQNKIIVAVHSDNKIRGEILQRLIVKLGFARTPSDAAKIIRASVHDIDLSEAYFVLAGNYNFRESPLTTQRLFELAARGIAVVVSAKKIPKEFEPFCEAHYN